MAAQSNPCLLSGKPMRANSDLSVFTHHYILILLEFALRVNHSFGFPLHCILMGRRRRGRNSPSFSLRLCQLGNQETMEAKWKVLRRLGGVWRPPTSAFYPPSCLLKTRAHITHEAWNAGWQQHVWRNYTGCGEFMLEYKSPILEHEIEAVKWGPEMTSALYIQMYI